MVASNGDRRRTTQGRVLADVEKGDAERRRRRGIAMGIARVREMNSRRRRRLGTRGLGKVRVRGVGGLLGLLG